MTSAADPRAATVGDEARYSWLAVAVHWVTAGLVIGALLLALWLEQTSGAQRGALVRLHKSLGLTVLAVSFLRVASLVFLRRPAPLTLKAWERRAARTLHTLLYLLLLTIPLVGWAMISADGGKFKTLWFGWLYVPKIQAIADLPEGTRKAVHALLGDLHLALGLALVALLLVHVGAVVKHEARDNVRQLRRMMWKVRG